MVSRVAAILRPLVSIALLAAVVVPAGAQEARRYPHIVIVTIDTLRTDRLSSYGYHRPTSPHLDRLIGDGIQFTEVER